MNRRFALIATSVLLASCSSAPKSETETAKRPADPAPITERPAAPADPSKVFRVRFTTNKGPFIMEVHRDWAPIGAQRLEELVKDKYFDGARFFRIVPNFVVQFGIAGSPSATRKWNKEIKDDPVTQTNRRGSVAFATRGPETRTAQLFINLASNQRLDSMGFAPVAQIVEGMDIVDGLYAEYGEQPDQQAIERQGNTYLNANFPKLDYIVKAEIIQ